MPTSAAAIGWAQLDRRQALSYPPAPQRAAGASHDGTNPRRLQVKAAVCERYGPPEAVVIKDVPMPVVGAGDVLIRVKATAVTIADARVRAVRVPRGLSIPTRLAMGILRPRHPVFGLEVASKSARRSDRSSPASAWSRPAGSSSAAMPSSWRYRSRAQSPQSLWFW